MAWRATLLSVQGFATLEGRLAVVPGDHLDTDRIIPARFLTRVTRFGYGELLFADARIPGSGVDDPRAVGANVLLVGTNFGCGSSREHAVWAIQQAGFRAVIARKDGDSPGYSDIFRQNAANCGLLLIEMDAEAHAAVAEAGPGGAVFIDLPEQAVTVGSSVHRFEIDQATKSLLVRGLDLIGATLVHEAEITRYEIGRAWQ